ncbi:MAG: exodeoxyribonuclease III [Peptococcaceae bacterium]|nr:exodeoxyribonuclease III [Peptococcaceae bacterium]
MRIISWNVNGFRAVLKRDFMQSFSALDADIFCLQETKLQKGQHEVKFKGYSEYWNYAEKKGYSGTAIFTKEAPMNKAYGIGIEAHDKEGRVVTLEYPAFYMVNCYTPNSRDGLVRLDYRMDWEDDFRKYLAGLKQKKPVVLCGDLNVAHQEIDLKNPKTNHNNAGFTDQEREKFSQLMEAGFADSFRRLYPDRTDAYSWWSYRANARERNIGWRIDYFVVSEDAMPAVRDSRILPEVTGSDHCPVLLEIEF